MASNPLTALVAAGQSPWIDFIRRSFMADGSFGKLISDGEIRGATSNPTIFEKAIGGSHDYDDQLAALVSQGMTDPKAIFDELAIVDIQSAADLLRPVFASSNGVDGYISLEVSPLSANDTEATVREARYLWGRVNRPNVMIKVPATSEGLPAIATLLSEGINVNITLIFALDVYEQVAQTYITALKHRAAAGEPVDHIASVASFFVSRVDSEVDKRLEALATADPARAAAIRALEGKAAIANAKLAYARYQAIFGEAFAELRAQGANPQRCLWASTSTKNPNYRDVLYAEELVGPETVDTMPPQTIEAFRDHGQVRQSLVEQVEAARTALAQIEALGIRMAEVTKQLELDGVKLFAESYNTLLTETAKRIEELRAKQTGHAGGANSTHALGALAGPVAAALEQLDRDRIGKRISEKDYTVWKQDAAIGAKIHDRLGWLDIARFMEGELGEIEAFAHELRVRGTRHVVLLGMGGSSLCPEVFRQTFGRQSGAPDLFVLDSTDPMTLLNTERQLDLRVSLFIVASKSGATLETQSHFAYFYERARQAVGEREVGSHFVAITDPGTHLEALANQFSFAKVFRNPADIGGRYSALSKFGLVPATLAGYDVRGLLDSALAMTQACDGTKAAAQNPGLTLGAIMGTAWKQGRDKVTIIASPAISSVGLWIEQLIAESTGKEGRGILPVAGEALGTPHDYGSDRLFVYLRLENQVDAVQDQAIAALEAAGHPIVRIMVSDPLALAGEFYRWEMATAVAGHLLGINPFDEPNVQESKDNTKRILEEFRAANQLPPTPATFIQDGVGVIEGSTVAGQLAGVATLTALRQAIAHLARPGDYIAVMAYLEPTGENDQLLQRFRLALRDASNAATTFGYGPRFLHSTGQLHKGGANNGVFVQIVADDREDLRIPGQPYSFGTLIHAQSLGDYQSLLTHQRRVVRINLGGEIRRGLSLLAGS